MQRSFTKTGRTASLILAALLAAATAQAQQAYLGASVGQSSFNLDTTGATAADTRDIGYKLFGGAMFNPYLGAEGALFDLGQASGSAAVPGYGRLGITGKVRGASLAGVAALPLGDARVFAKAGVAYVRASVDASLAGLSSSETESSAQPVFGVGASYAFTPQLVGRIEWERIRVRYSSEVKDNADFVSAGLAWHF